MPGKIRLVKAGEDSKGGHHFLVYSPDGTFGDTGDMMLMSGQVYVGPDGKPYLKIGVEPFEESFDYNTFLTDIGPLDWAEEYFDDIDLPSGTTAEDFVDRFTALRDSYGVAGSDGFSQTDIPFNGKKAPNSSSVVGTGIALIGQDINEYTPKKNGTGTASPAIRGEDGILDSDDPDNGANGDQTWIADGEIVDFYPLSKPSESGTDNIIVRNDGQVTIHPLRGDGEPNQKLVIEGVDPQYVRLLRVGDDLLVIANGHIYAILKEYYKKPQVTGIEVDDGTGPVPIDPSDPEAHINPEEADNSQDEGYDENAEDGVETGEGQTSPLVLDLDDSGTIELTSLANSGAKWDLDQDGFRETTGWVTGGDGLLALDKNENGTLDDNGELFGTADTDGFTVLAEHDSNEDGIISAEDAVWGDILVWVDGNENGYSETGELYSLDQLDIVSIDLGATEVSSTNQGHSISHTSTFTVDDGVNPADQRAVHDVWFTYDDVDTVYNGEYDLNDYAAYLPEAKGYGIIPDLRIAMSLDDDGTGNLLDLVYDFAALEFDELFSETTGALDSVKDILFRWAGVDGVAPDSRSDNGYNIDARELEFMEHFIGRPFSQSGHSDPGGAAANDVHNAFLLVLNNVYARLAIQSAGVYLFEGDARYEKFGDTFTDVEALNLDVLDELETIATGLANSSERTVFWQNVVRVIEFSVGVDGLSGPDQTALEDAIYDSDNTLDLYSDILDGMGGLTSLYGSGDNDDLSGDGLANTLNGGAGHDRLQGQGNDDTLNGGTGNDFLLGGLGNDTYYYAAGDGYDTIDEVGVGAGQDDRIVFGPGIDAGDLTLTRFANTDLIIDIDNGTYTGRILIEDQFNAGPHVETIEFDDTSTMSLVGLAWTMHGTDGADTLHGVTTANALDTDTIYGGGGNDTINGQGGDDVLYGEAGNDIIYGEYGEDTLYGGDGDDYLEGGGDDDILSGGAGNDRMRGGVQNDAYIYSSGNDTIYDAGNTDEINLDAAWNGITPQYLRIGYDLIIWFDTANTITVEDHFNGKAVESMVYANTTTVDLTTVTAISQGDETNNTLTGTSSADTIYGNGGDDTINGSGGNDLLYGGTGADSLSGGNGDDYLDGGAGDDVLSGGGNNDTYYYSSGHDEIYDTSGTGTLIFAPGWAFENMSFVRYSTDQDRLVIEISAVNSIELDSQFSGAKTVDTLQFQAGTVNAVDLQVTTYGTSGNDTIGGISNLNALETDIIYGLDGNDTINGQNGADTLYGGDGDDTLEGGNGNDLLYGGVGDDFMEGNGGDDIYVFETGLDTVTDYLGNYSNDTLWITGDRTINDIIGFANEGTSSTRITITASVDEILVQYLRGGTQHHVEWITFDDGFTTSLPDYATWLNGSSGNDMVAGNGSDNTLVGFAGNDSITGGDGNDDAHGGAGNDTLEGGNGSDLLYGGVGDDTIYGEAGLDTMHGGDGEDTFVFETASAFSDVDVIRDFSAADDVLDLTDILDTVYDPMTDAIADFIQFTESSGSTFVEVDRDGTGSTYSFAQIVKLENVTGLSSPELLETNGNLLAA